jgi:hypothetical protein
MIPVPYENPSENPFRKHYLSLKSESECLLYECAETRNPKKRNKLMTQASTSIRKTKNVAGILLDEADMIWRSDPKRQEYRLELKSALKDMRYANYLAERWKYLEDFPNCWRTIEDLDLDLEIAKVEDNPKAFREARQNIDLIVNLCAFGESDSPHLREITNDALKKFGFGRSDWFGTK